MLGRRAWSKQQVYDRARLYFELAAQKGHVGALCALAILYANKWLWSRTRLRQGGLRQGERAFGTICRPRTCRKSVQTWASLLFWPGW
jgi:TPR repeat protein